MLIIYLKLWDISKITYFKNNTYIKNKSSPRIEPWGKLQDTDADWEKLFPSSTRNDLLDK